MRSYLIILACVFITSFAAAQNVRSSVESVGFGVQRYPAGIIFNLRSEWKVSANSVLIGKLGYNIARRKDFGKHDNEEGGGPGFTLAYKCYLKPGLSGWFIEGRTSMWFLDIDWRDEQPARSGNTNISVLQPTAGIGYEFVLNEKMKLGLVAAFGYELNIVTNGEPVGEGGISLIGFSLAYRLEPSRSAAAKRN